MKSSDKIEISFITIASRYCNPPYNAARAKRRIAIGTCAGLSWLCLLLGFALSADAQTPICGNLTTTTWTPAGNPYIIGCDSTVLSGNTLTIQPGVVVWMGSNVTLTVNGLIQAVGVPGNRITFQPPGSSQTYWNAISLINACMPDTAFCDLCLSNSPSHGTQVPDMGAYGGPDACNWLDEVPLIRTHPGMSQANNLVSINWDAIPCSTYEIQFITNVTDGAWKPLTTVTATEKPTSRTVISTNRERYFRLESLGRSPGN